MTADGYYAELAALTPRMTCGGIARHGGGDRYSHDYCDALPKGHEGACEKRPSGDRLAVAWSKAARAEDDDCACQVWQERHADLAATLRTVLEMCVWADGCRNGLLRTDDLRAAIEGPPERSGR